MQQKDAKGISPKSENEPFLNKGAGPDAQKGPRYLEEKSGRGMAARWQRCKGTSGPGANQKGNEESGDSPGKRIQIIIGTIAD